MLAKVFFFSFFAMGGCVHNTPAVDCRSPSLAFFSPSLYAPMRPELGKLFFAALKKTQSNEQKRAR